MSRVVAYGIDYGTSNSSVAAVDTSGKVRVLPVSRDGATMLRSVAYLHRDGNRLAGDESIRAYLVNGSERTRCGGCALVDHTAKGAVTQCMQHRPGSGCQDSRLIAQVKTDLSSDAMDRTHSWAQDFEFVDLVSIVLRRLKREADRATGQDVRRVALGHPVRFAGTESDPQRLQQLAQTRLSEAARRAGFEEIVLVPESQAAVAVEEIDDGLVVCTDFGGGTFDVAVLEKRGSKGEVLALRGEAVGGEDFDSRIFDLKMTAALELDTKLSDAQGRPLALPSWFKLELRSMAGLRRLLSDNTVPVILRELASRPGGEFADTLNELLYAGEAYHCYRAVENAKIALSTAETTNITFRRSGRINVDVPFDRAELDALIQPDLKRVRYCIEDALEDAAVHPDDVSYVTRTGGSSQIPAFQDVLSGIFDVGRIVERDAFSTVVTGLARYAYAEWRAAA